MPFVLYRSSAGSGKTYTLVKEYLNLVLRNPEKFQNILAITFTNKAAAEMKERILLALKKLAKGENSGLKNGLQESLGQEMDIAAASAGLQTRLLHNYSDFAILTIDSFIHRVLRAFALETGLPLSFSIELNYERLYSYVLERLLGSVGRDAHISNIILALVDQRLLEGKSWNIEKDIKKFVSDLFSEKNVDWAQEIQHLDAPMYRVYKEQLEKLRDHFIKSMNALCQKALNLIKEANLDEKAFAYGKSGVYGFFEKKAVLNAGDLKQFEMSKRLLEEIWFSKSTPPAIISAINTLLENGLAKVRSQIIQLVDSSYKKALTAHFILENFYLAAIVGQIKIFIEEYKARYNVVPISEFNIKVYDIVRESPVPFIYEILGEKFMHYLIDEFQDTSRLQWNNLFPLIDNSLASDYFNLAVGDGKQSIYRWRGGDVEIMESEIRQSQLQVHLQEKNLGCNFRSRTHVVQFNNLFFASLSSAYLGQNPMLEKIYRDTAQEPAAQAGGLVTLQLLPEMENKDEVDPLIFEKVNQLIRQCLLEEQYNQRDITILVRNKKEGKKIADNLMNQPEKYKVVSPDSLILANIPLIRFLIDLLTFLDNPNDIVAKAAVVYYLCLHRRLSPFSPDSIGPYFSKDEQPLLESYPELKHFMSVRKFLIRLPVYEVVEEVIRIFQLQTSLDFETNAYLQAFLNIVANYSAENHVDFSSFLNWWRSNEEQFSLEIPENASAIKIMTIHKAKGLEFPIVILPYANWDHKLDNPLWLNPDAGEFVLEPSLPVTMPVKSSKTLSKTSFVAGYEAEKHRVEIDNINLLYVAFTRAVDQLHIIAAPLKKSTGIEGEEDEAITYTNYQLLLERAVPLLQKKEDRESYYFLGGADKKEMEPKPVDEILYEDAQELISNQWYKKITIRRKAVEFWRFEPPYPGDRRRWGLVVHRVLATIKNAADIPLAVTLLLNAGEIETQEQPLLIQQITRLFDHPTVRDWFDSANPVFIESSIYSDSGVLRPDRVIFYPDRVVIIDFKTGVREPVHARQLLAYRETLIQMGYPLVDAYLLYLEECQIETVHSS